MYTWIYVIDILYCSTVRKSKENSLYCNDFVTVVWIYDIIKACKVEKSNRCLLKHLLFVLTYQQLLNAGGKKDIITAKSSKYGSIVYAHFEIIKPKSPFLCLTLVLELFIACGKSYSIDDAYLSLRFCIYVGFLYLSQTLERRKTEKQ